MKKMQLATWLQNKMVLAALLMILVAGTVVAGVLALRNEDSGEQDETEPGYAFQTQEDDPVRDQQLDQQLNQQENDKQAEDPAEGWLEHIPKVEQGLEGSKDPDGLLQLPEDHPVQSGEIDVINGAQEGLEGDLTAVGSNQAEAETLVSGEDAVIYEPDRDVEEVAAPGATLEFQAGSTIGWPVFGNVLLDYSMDTTIYFPTLKQYKCNPGILIQAEVGQPVEAAVRGQVTDIGFNEELGNFIMMELGGDYTICYGQLDEIQVEIGQIVEPGQMLGVVAQPTKYYVVEGPNIYVEMRYQQNPVDPLDYIR